MSKPSLEHRIASALASEDIKAVALADLIEETQTAIDAADKAAEAERTKALDPTLSPDPKAARAAMEDAAFTHDRLRPVLPRGYRRVARNWRRRNTPRRGVRTTIRSRSSATRWWRNSATAIPSSSMNLLTL